MPCSLVSYYGEKESELNRYLTNIQQRISHYLGEDFSPYSITQIHGTIIGLETVKIQGKNYSKWCQENNKSKPPIDFKGLLNFLSDPPKIENFKFGGFEKNKNYGFLSWNRHPFYRTFSIRGNTMVINGWPVHKKNDPEGVTHDLYDWRVQLESFNLCHKWNIDSNQDNDLFMVVGKINSLKSKNDLLDQLCQQMWEEISHTSVITSFSRKNVGLVEYQSTELPIDTTTYHALDELEEGWQPKFNIE